MGFFQWTWGAVFSGMMLQRMHIFSRLTLRDCRIRVCAHAEGFEKRQVPSGSQPQIASVAESRIKRIHSSLLCKASSACTRIVLSSESGMVELRLL